MAGMIMDAVLMLLLVAAVGYGVKLERKLTALRAGQLAFAQAVTDLNAAAGRAEAALATGLTGAAPGMASAVARNATIAKVSASGKIDEAGQKAGHFEGAANQAAQQAKSPAEQGQLMLCKGPSV